MSTASVILVPRQDWILLLSEVGRTDPIGIPEQQFGELCPRRSSESVFRGFAIGHKILYPENSTCVVMAETATCDPRRRISMPPRSLCLQELTVRASIGTIVSAVPIDCRLESFAHALALVALALGHDRAALALLEGSVPSLLVFPGGGLLVQPKGNDYLEASVFLTEFDDDRLFKPPLRVISIA